jgi:NAD-dependent DNA ligase
MMDLTEFYEIWNQKHCELIVQGPAIRNKLMADFCEETILNAKNAYYNTEKPVMTDEAYDKTEEYLRLLRPDSKALEKVGS